MKIAYHADNAIDAQLISDLLNDNDIFAQVRGANMQGAVGEAPAMGNVKVWVHDEDFDNAREIIEAWDEAKVLDDDDGYSDTYEPIQNPSNKTMGSFKLFSAFVLGALVVLFAQKYKGILFSVTSSFTEDGSIMKMDANYDGKDDSFYYFNDQGFLSELHLDQNFDGEIDLISLHDSRGLPESGKVDNDFDGVFETREKFNNGVLVKSESDFDGDGYYEKTSLHKYEGGLVSEVYLSQSEFGSPKKYQRFENSVLSYAKFDRDGDGKYDVEYYYDELEEVKSKKELH